MNKKYNLKLDLQFRCNNSTMKFNQFDNNTSDFFMRITNGGKLVDIEKAIVILAIIKPSGKVSSQFVEVKNDVIYADLKPSMKDEIGTYTAKAMLILEDERVVTDVISYEVEEDKIFSLLNDSAEDTEEFTLLTDMLNRLSTMETNEEQRVINEAERILSEENRKTEEAERVEAELIRQHEEADRAKYDATRESNENIRKINEEARISSENVRLENEANRIEQEANRVKAEQLRKDNYNFMTEDEERRRLEANAHKEAEALRVQAETNRVNEEAKRRTTEQARVSAENTRVSNENTRKDNETTRQTNETHRVEAETQRQNRYNSFIADAEANANNFENYTNSAKVKEEERKSNELDRKSQEAKRVSNEVERISNENTRKANEVAREKNETSRQNIFENKVSEVDEKIVELNTTKDNFVSSINTKVDTKISELDNAKSDMTNTVSNKINEVETRFNRLTSQQQQDAEVIDARDGETSLKARLDRDIEKAKQVYVNVEGSNISTDSSSGYAKDVEILGNTVQDASNLADIRSVGDKVEGQELYEIPVLSSGKNLLNNIDFIKHNQNTKSELSKIGCGFKIDKTNDNTSEFVKTYLELKQGTYSFSFDLNLTGGNTNVYVQENEIYGTMIVNKVVNQIGRHFITFTINKDMKVALFFDVRNNYTYTVTNIQLEEGTQATPYESYQEDKLTILSPVQLERVGDVADRIICKDGIWGVEKNIHTEILDINNTFNNTSSYAESGYRAVNISNLDYPCVPTKPTLMCNKLKYYINVPNSTECITSWSNAQGFIIKLSVNTIGEDSLLAIKEYIINNNFIVKYPLQTPQFIPLPHSQQVKLRAFANKTNISFGCEIEGTIKAQVPKSIGATVNTHTEQINNLNKELDRVKKLEESTVSTVTTESDLTTVEATSNGYFEDVKLKGKTLVNIVNDVKGSTKQTIVADGSNKNISYNTSSALQAGKEYTFIVYISKNTLEGNGYMYLANSYTTTPQVEIPKNSIGLVTRKITISNEHFDRGFQQFAISKNMTGGEIDIDYYMILEGDHTQNPPSYFEGLKSVGQSASEDGADEIVVSSVKGDGNLIDGEFYKLTEHIAGVNCSCLAKNTTYTINFDIDVAGGLIGLISDKSEPEKTDFLISNWGVFGNTITFTTPQSFIEKEYTIIFRKTDIHLNMEGKKAILNKGTTPKPYTPHQSDKKRLLYYNNETQTWEKPILREWDSIEKHADGKYYYHQRSGEAVLNGSENWAMIGSNFGEFNCFYLAFNLKINGKSVLSDKFASLEPMQTEANSVIGEGISTHHTTPSFRVVVSKSKLSTQDVQGFKQWLQANNVTVVYQLAQEKVYECTNIDLITYNGETNYIVSSGAIAPKTILKVHNNISNVVSLLQKKVSLLESDITSYMITQNRLMLASRYNADTVSFKVDVASFSDTFEYDNDLYELILNNILVGKDNYNREYIENLIIFYWMDFIISDEMYSTLFEIIEEQHNPKIEKETPLI